MINSTIKSQVRNLLQYEDILKNVGEDLKRKWRSQSPKKQTVDETMYQVGKQDGMCEAIDTLFQELEILASNQNE